MVNLMNLINITNDEKSLLECVADRLDKDLSETREALSDYNNITDTHYYVVGNHLIDGATLKSLLDDQMPETVQTIVHSLNVTTNVYDDIELQAIVDELADATQGAEIIIAAIRAATSEGISTISDYFQVFNTKVNNTISGITSASRSMINSIVNFVSASGESIVNGIASFLTTLSVTIGSDGEITYSAKNYLGVNPFISGFSHMDILDLTINVISTVTSIVVSIFAGAVGMLVGSAISLLWDIAKYAMTAVTNPVDVYTRNVHAKPMFDRSGHDISVWVSSLDSHHWAFDLPDNCHYVFMLPSGELHVIKQPEGGNDEMMLTIRVIRYSLSTPNGFAQSNGSAVRSYIYPMEFNGKTPSEARNMAATQSSTGVLQLTQDDDELQLFSWASSTTADTNVLQAIYAFDSDDNYLANGLIHFNEVCCAFNGYDPSRALVYCPSPTNSKYQWLSLNRGPVGLDPDHTYTNHDWFGSFYTRHEKGKVTTSTNYSWSALGNAALYDAVNGCRGGFWADASEITYQSDFDAQKRAALFWSNLAGICVVRLLHVWDDVSDDDPRATIRNTISSYQWIDDSWLWRKVLCEDRGAYAIYTDSQNADRAGAIYSAIIIGAAATTAAIVSGVVKGQLKKKAYSASRKLDIMAFDQNYSDQQCRWQGVKAGFWSALSGYGSTNEEVLNEGQSLLDTIKDAFYSRKESSDISDQSEVTISSIKGSENYSITDNADMLSRILRTLK